MRILVGSIDMDANRFFGDLNAALRSHATLLRSWEEYWAMRGKFDIVHLHHPEYLTPAIQKAYDTCELNENLIQECELRLKHWAQRSRIVITRHNLVPHHAQTEPAWERLYRLFFRYADGVVHLGRASLEQFKEHYRNLRFFRGQEPAHIIIPHHNYATLPNQLTRAEARNRLRIGPSRSVMLVFGAVRNDAERDLVLKTFHNVRVCKKLLLVPRWRERLPNVSWIRLRNWIRDAKRFYYRHHPHYSFGYAFVKEADTQLYLNAADLLFIPRSKVLNSGNVALGMTFGKVVVGPDSLNVGEVLRSTGNPVFNPDRPETASMAVEEGFRLVAAGKIGVENRERALRECNVATCAQQYLRLFNALASPCNLSPCTCAGPASNA